MKSTRFVALAALPGLVAAAQAADLTTIGSTTSRYLVSLGKGYGDTIVQDAITPFGLYDYASAGGNGGPWFHINDGVTGIPTAVANTFRGPNPDFFGYRFKLPVQSLSRVDFYNRVYFDGGTFNAAPAVQYLDALDGAWHTIENVTWSPPYDRTFSETDEIRAYQITIHESPPAPIWGVRLLGDANPDGGINADPTGFIGIAELIVHGEFSVESVDLSVNLAAAGPGVTPIANTDLQYPLSNLLDGDLNTYATTWDNRQLFAEDYVGVQWDSPKANLIAMGVVFKRFPDGGLFDECRHSFRIEYTTGSDQWTPVTGLNKGRYIPDWFTIMQVGWDIETGYLFTFDPVPSATGIRIIGKAHGSSLDVDGFIAVTDLQVFAKSAPAMAPRAAKQKKSKP